MPKINYCIDCGKKCQGRRCRFHRSEHCKTEEYRQKMRETSNFKKGRIPWNKGLKFVHQGSFKRGHPSYPKLGTENPNWKGGRYINTQGYVNLRINKKYVLEHVKVVEDFLGRKLKKGNVIHHINEIKTDNRIENLMIFPSVTEHMAFHNKLKRYKYVTNPMKRQIENRWIINMKGGKNG